MSERDTAALLGVSQKTLQGWRMRGEGPQYAKINARLIRYRRADLDEFIAAKMQQPSDSRGVE
jgi:predicted DNA-binding transcriptional regulator AlpA